MKKKSKDYSKHGYNIYIRKKISNINICDLKFNIIKKEKERKKGKNSMNTSLGLNSPNIIGARAPILTPIIPHFPFSSKPRLEAIHVSDLPKGFNPAVDSIPTVKKAQSQSKIITTILTLTNLVSTYFSADSQSVKNAINQTNSQLNGSTNTSSSRIIRNRYNCRYGYQGRYCDPCGLTFKPPIVNKIVGGFEATPHSWPSAALIVFNYKAEVFLQDQRVYYNLDEQMVCGGSLISRDTSLN